MWATMANKHPLLPKPLQPGPLTFPPPDPSATPGPTPPPPAGPSQHPLALAQACHQKLPLTRGFVPVMIKNLSFTPRQGLAPANSLTLVQHNSLGSWDVFLSLFSSFTEGSPVDIVLLQDPPSSKGFLPSFCGFKSFAPPIARHRVACYVSQKVLQCFAILPCFPLETEDFMALDVFTQRGCFSSSFPRFRIGNWYARLLPPAPHSVSPEWSILDVDYPYLVAGDFNIHNSATDPSRLLSSGEESESAPYFDQATDIGFTLHNTPGIYTRFPFTGTHRPSAIYMAFANRYIFPAFHS